MSQINLIPGEVLSHLKHILGPDLDMTHEEFQSFLHDLRKLMRKDNKAANGDKENREGFKNCDCQCHLPISSRLNLTEGIESESMDTDCNDSSTNYNYDLKLQVKKPAPSFIRPWRTRPANKSSKNITPGDPVRLYRQYKNLWQQQRIPGEQNHATIRWNIRERMLGQAPQPRPLLSAPPSQR